jgi:hypothetical protein
MKPLKELLARKGTKASKTGNFSPWTFFTDVEIRGGALQFTEARVIGLRGNEEHECYEVPVENGTFTVQCRVARFGADARVAAMRAFPSSIDPDRLVRRAVGKDLPVDLGGIAIVDIGKVHSSMSEDEARLEEWYDYVLYGHDDSSIAVHTWKPTKSKIPRVESGFGDGAYPLHELLFDGKAVGLEVTFIQDGAAYPFPVVEVADSVPVQSATPTPGPDQKDAHARGTEVDHHTGHGPFARHKKGLLADIYVSSHDEATKYDAMPEQFTDRAQYCGVEPGLLSVLWSIMRDIEWDVAMLEKFPWLLPKFGGKSQIYRIPAEMVAELAVLSPDRIGAVASAWAATEELNCRPEDIIPVVGDLVRLARRAVETDLGVYLWNRA